MNFQRTFKAIDDDGFMVALILCTMVSNDTTIEIYMERVMTLYNYIARKVDEIIVSLLAENK